MAAFSLLPKRAYFSLDKVQLDFSIWINLEDEIRKDAEVLGWLPQDLVITVLDQFLQAAVQNPKLKKLEAPWKPSVGSHVMNLQFPRRLKDELVSFAKSYNDHDFGIAELIRGILTEYVVWRRKLSNT